MRTRATGVINGFSLVEMLIALVLVIGVAGAALGLFAETERLFRDSQITLEMHQSARAVASMIADDVARAGQLVPVFAGSFEDAASEALNVFLPGTGPALLQLRIHEEPGGVLDDPMPILFEVGRQRTVTVRSAGLSASIGDNVFLWGPSQNTWTWVRARVDGVLGGGRLLLTPIMLSSEGGLLIDRPTVAVESGVSYRLSGRSILRGELRGFMPSGDPVFRELSIGDDFTSLALAYEASDGQAIDPGDPDARGSIRRVEVEVQAETSEPLSDGRRRRYSIAFTISPRNLEVW